MNIHKVCKSDCTACNACANICPNHCIEFENGEAGYSFAVVNEEKCIKCHLCEMVCPNLKAVKKAAPLRCFAAWALDTSIRANSASGGIATILYQYYSDQGYWCAGVRMKKNFEASYELLNPQEDKKCFSNSKYVYSNTDDIYSEVVKKLKNNQGVLFIGLPCQVAGLKNYLNVVKCSSDKLLTIDIICHGVTSGKLLQQHISYLMKKKGFHADQVLFRDPKYKTSSYTFSLKENDRVRYAKNVCRDDAYQIGYHCGITYRENCYHCKYATPERVGDLTLSDFAYVGCVAPCSYSNENVSCVMVNTQCGQRIIDTIKNAKMAFFEERPLEEVMEKEHQLKAPTEVPKERYTFIYWYEKTHDFNHAMRKAARKIMLKNDIVYYLHIQQTKRLMVRMLPQKLIRTLKEVAKA